MYSFRDYRLFRKIFIDYIYIFLLFLVACSGQPEQIMNPPSDVPSEEFFGPIPADEYRDLLPQRVDALVNVMEKVVLLNPNLLNDEDAFTRAVFDELIKQQDMPNQQFLSEFLTQAEQDVVFLNIHKTYLAYGAISKAREAAREIYPCELKDGRGDAIRHAVWNALMARAIADHPDYTVRDGLIFAEAIGDAHESEPDVTNPNAEREKDMDLNNNAVGREVIENNQNATAEELIEIIKSTPMQLVKEGKIPFDVNNLFYFGTSFNCDIAGDYEGTVTNSEGGTVSNYIRLEGSDKSYSLEFGLDGEIFSPPAYECSFNTDTLECRIPFPESPKDSYMLYTGKADGLIWSGDLIFITPGIRVDGSTFSYIKYRNIASGNP